jgi:hypothetical protein
MQTLHEISSMGKANSLPHVIDRLKDTDPDIKLQALVLLGTYGSDKNVAAAEALLSDKNAQVRTQAQLTVEDLWHKNTVGVITQNQQFAPPGDYDINRAAEENQNTEINPSENTHQYTNLANEPLL